MASVVPSTTLYIGDLPPDMDTVELSEFLVGRSIPVISARVVNDRVTGQSLRYGYINFNDVTSASKCLEKLNLSKVKDRIVRVMWKSKEIQNKTACNLFVKNLPKVDFDATYLFDTFSDFGTILSCKICMDDNGKSKGFGFVQFDTEAQATAALEKMNGKVIGKLPIVVSRFISRKNREAQPAVFTNVYIKPLVDSCTESQLRERFAEFGNVTSVFIPKNEKNESKLFGFVNYDSYESAKAAIETMNLAKWNDQQLYVSRAQRKAERQTFLQNQRLVRKNEQMEKYRGTNLYIKNLPPSIETKESLETLFSPFGKIRSAHLASDDKNALRGFGFVAFETQEQANVALKEMNSKLLGSKPLYVAFAQTKSDRRNFLNTIHPVSTGGRNFAPVFSPSQLMNYVPRSFMQGPMQRSPYMYPMMPPRTMMPSMGAPMSAGGMPPMAIPMMMPPGGPQRGGRSAPQSVQVQQGRPPRQPSKPHAAPARVAVPASKPAPSPAAHAAPVAPAAPVADEEELKQMLGEQIYEFISATRFSALAPRITGILLGSLSVGQLSGLFERKNELIEKVEEAFNLIQSSTAEKPAQ